MSSTCLGAFLLLAITASRLGIFCTMTLIFIIGDLCLSFSIVSCETKIEWTGSDLQTSFRNIKLRLIWATAMLTSVVIGIASLCLALPLGEAVKCYHCYDSFTKDTLAMGTFEDPDHGQKFVRCDKNKNNWNTWDCPAHWPVCVLVTGKVQGHTEVIRTCAVENYCKVYVPPPSVKMEYCRECNTTLCNDYQKLSGPLFTFNININLNLEKYPTVSVPGIQ